MTISQNLGLLAPQVNTSGNISYENLTNKPSLSAVATSGSYADLSNKPVVISLKGSTVTYPGDDLAADLAGAQTITITGTGFESTPTVYIGGTIAPSVTFVSATQISVTTPAKAAGTYDIYIVNPGGATAIMVFGISYSGTPSWTTAAGSLGTQETSSWTIQLQATSNSAVTYALTSGSTLPSGVTLSSSGLITGTNVTTQQTFNFSVTATDAELQDTPRSFAVSVNVGDPYFKYTTLLLSGDGTNAAQNNTFVDSSTNNFSITRNGNTTQGSFSPYGSNWSNYFDGASRIFTASNSAFVLGTGDFTIECWINMASGTTLLAYWRSFLSVGADGTSNGNGVTLYVTDGGSGSSVAGEVAVNIGTTRFYSGQDIRGLGWVHVALTRQGTTNRLFLNGVLKSTITNSLNIDATNYGASVGLSSVENSNYFIGYISNARVVKGTAVYTSNFTPSTTPLTVISGTSLLTCADNRFIDESTNNFAFTIVGTPSVQRFNPFSLTNAYSTNTIGGSGYFDGSGDRVYTPTTSALNITGDFTIECWIYRTAEASSYPMVMICSQGSISAETGLVFNFPTTGINFSWGDGGISGGSLAFNEWNHVAATRSGSTTRIFVNGVQKASTDTSYTFATGYPWYLGDRPAGASGANYPFAGYISDARIIKNQAIYTSNFTPPTAPVTAVTNTQLLINFTNAAIVDSTMMNDLETVDNAQISTNVKKYGTGSIYLDGTSDYLSARSTPNLSISSGDFTIECWAYATSLSSYNALFAQWPDNGGTANNSYVLESVGSDMLFYWVSGTTLYGPATLGTSTTGSWIHWAICRSGNTLYPFKNGVLGTPISITQTLNSPTSAVTIGGAVAGGGNWIGYIDDLRVTKGIARYTANFTPPTTAHKLK